jgi:CBS domain containing-hemolysin-like protein
MAGSISGKPMYMEDVMADELEELIDMLEAGGKIEPDAGRILRTTLAASRSDVLSSMTPIEKIVSVDSDSSVMEALKVMGKTSHPRIPVYDKSQGQYVGVLTFRSLSKGISEERLADPVTKHMVMPARVEADEPISAVAERMSKAGVTMAFVYREGRIIGVITLTDLLERILGFKLV